MVKRTFKKNNRKQTGSGGCFSSVKELKEINTSLETISTKYSTGESLTAEELEALEAEYKKIIGIIGESTTNNVNNNQPLNNNNNEIRKQLGMNQDEYAELSKELADLLNPKKK
jgi:hypothetical protein